MSQPHSPRALLGLQINAPAAVAKVKDYLPAPCECPYCASPVELVSNAVIYGKPYGWPLTYRCVKCWARVGCHPGTDIPLGTLADAATQKARMAAHDAFDPLWKSKGPGARGRAYRLLAKSLGLPVAHISWFDAPTCWRVVELCRSGTITL